MNALLNATPAPDTIYTLMSRLLNLKLNSETDAFRIVREGISAHTYSRLVAKLKIPAELVASQTTVRRRLAENSRFSVAESERAVRLARVFAEAQALFGDEKAALTWFSAPAEYISGGAPITPMALAATDTGARLIESNIRRTAYGLL